MNKYVHPEVLVSTDWVLENLDKPDIKIVEISLEVKAYDAGHIPGAVGFNWETQTQDQIRRDIVSKADFEKLLGESGISPEDTVVIYGDFHNWFAAYGFWVFKIYGHQDVRLMNGGRAKWLNEDKPLTPEVPTPTPVVYKAREPDLSLRAFAPDVLEIVKTRNSNLIDVRSPDEFSGKIIAPAGMNETAQRAGHIPGAASVPWSEAVQEDGTFKSYDQLKRSEER